MLLRRVGLCVVRGVVEAVLRGGGRGRAEARVLQGATLTRTVRLQVALLPVAISPRGRRGRRRYRFLFENYIFVFKVIQLD